MAFSDVRESVNNVLDEIEDRYHTKVDYPMADFIIVFGFFVVLLIEQIMLDFKERWKNESGSSNHQGRAPHTNERHEEIHDHSEAEIDERSSLLRSAIASGDSLSTPINQHNTNEDYSTMTYGSTNTEVQQERTSRNEMSNAW